VYVAPTYRQAKRVAWKPLKQMTKPYWVGKPNETDLTIELMSGGTISLRGADNYDSPAVTVSISWSSMNTPRWRPPPGPRCWRPALADRQGRALFIARPRGHNHLFDLYEAAQSRIIGRPFQYTTEEGGNVSKQELESATARAR